MNVVSFGSQEMKEQESRPGEQRQKLLKPRQAYRKQELVAQKAPKAKVEPPIASATSHVSSKVQA